MNTANTMLHQAHGGPMTRASALYRPEVSIERTLTAQIIKHFFSNVFIRSFVCSFICSFVRSFSLSTSSSICLSVCPLIYPSINLYVHLSQCLCICPFVNPPISQVLSNSSKHLFIHWCHGLFSQSVIILSTLVYGHEL